MGGSELLQSSQRLIAARRAQNTRTVTFAAAVLTTFGILAVPDPAEMPLVFAAVAGNAAAAAIAYLLARQNEITAAATLVIGASFVEQVTLASQPEATLVIPFFAAALVLVGAACLPESWLFGVTGLALLTLGLEYLVAPSGLPQAALYSTFVSSVLLLLMTAVVAWLSLVGLERAFSRIQEAEVTQQELLLKLEKSSRLEALGRLASSVAHDFNNFLLVIRTSTELAQRKLTENDEAARELLQVERATERAAELTRQLLEFGKRRQEPLARIRVGRVIEELLPLLERLIGPSLSLRVELPTSENMVFATRTQLEQVLINLVSNARDASPKDDSISIRLTEQALSSQQVKTLPAGRYAELIVSDRGQGIAPEIIERLFEPLFTTKAEGRGSGLGLSTCSSIVERLGGTITVESVLGEGTSFHVFIPLAADSSRPWKSARGASIHPRSVLVFDSDEDVRALIKRLLVEVGDEVLCLRTLADCLREAEFGGHYDLIIVDAGPQASAMLSTLDRLHQLQPEALIVVTSVRPAASGLLSNVREHVCLPKPFSAGEFLNATQPPREGPARPLTD